MIRKIRYGLAAFICVLLVSCEKRMSYDEYSIYMNDPENGYFLECTYSDLKIRYQYTPTDFLFYKKNMTESELNSIPKNRYYFKLKLSLDNSSLEVFRAKNGPLGVQRVNEIKTLLKDNFKLIIEDQSYSPLDLIFQDDIGLGSFTNCLLVYEVNATKRKFKLFIDLPQPDDKCELEFETENIKIEY
ncbi:MAG: hypothetical protein O9302_06950 [Cyclobacteriaceae bacterium]|nr:hypothetical protein [Cyclobacteriaceae bacterium]